MKRRTLHLTLLALGSACALAAVAQPVLEKPKDKPAEPPRVVHGGSEGLPVFEGVVKPGDTKYTMFLPDGTPVRAATSPAPKTKGGDPKSAKKKTP
ncbi:MAG: hypothetical protein IV086_19005 [Hyphomonadaceae bacterium]|nr:hypothetical protein [Hyphomonadaceae bacterium]